MSRIPWREQLRHWVRGAMGGPARCLSALGVTPTMLTFMGFLASLVSGALFAAGHLSAAGWALLLAGLCDMSDGQVARISGRSSARGAYLDSFTDRWSDGAVLGGIIWFLAARQDWWCFGFALVALVGSFSVSYARARGENFVADCSVGFWERPERVILLLMAAFLGETALRIAVLILAVGTPWTALRRTLFVLRSLRNDSDSPH